MRPPIEFLNPEIEELQSNNLLLKFLAATSTTFILVIIGFLLPFNEKKPISQNEEENIKPIIQNKDLIKDSVIIKLAGTLPIEEKVAVLWNRGKSEPIVLVGEAMEAKNEDNGLISLRITPNEALLIASARKYGEIKVVGIPKNQPNPYIGQGIIE